MSVQDEHRYLLFLPPMDVLDILLINALSGVGLQAIKFTALLITGPLCHVCHGEEIVELKFEKCHLLPVESHGKVYELEAIFSAQRYPKVAKWLMVNGEYIHLFGHLFVDSNCMTLYVDKEQAALAFDYQPEGEETK